MNARARIVWPRDTISEAIEELRAAKEIWQHNTAKVARFDDLIARLSSLL